MPFGDGVSIVRKGKGARLAYLYRVYDAHGNRRAKSFRRTDVDANRDHPGTAEGDAWAERMRAQATLRGAVAAKLPLAKAAESYAVMAEGAGLSESYVGIVRNIAARAVAAGIADLRADDVAMRTAAWLARLTAARPGQRTPSKASPRLKNKALTVLRTIAQQQVKEGRLDRNPFAAVRRTKEVATEAKLFTIAELRTLVRDVHAKEPGWMLAVLGIYTGQRSETLRCLTWDMIDWDRGRINVPGAIVKQDNPVRVPLQAELAELLAPRAQRNASTIVPAGTVRDSDHANEVFTDYLVATCKIPRENRGLHVLRASHASLLIATGTPPTIVQTSVGWTQAQTMHRYIRAAEDYRDQVKDEGWPADDLYLRRDPPQAAQRRTRNGAA